MKTITTIIIVIILILIAVGIYFLLQPKAKISQSEQKINSNPVGNSAGISTDNSTSYIQGMKVEILKEGTGEGAKVGDNVVVNYVGTLLDGTKFDSSLNPGRTPFPFTLGVTSVIQGWQLGVQGMKVGEKRRLTIPSELGYGTRGAGGLIPPNATLIFEIDMISINK